MLSVFALLMGYEALAAEWYTTKKSPHRQTGEKPQATTAFVNRKANPQWYCDHFATPHGGERACIRTDGSFPMLVAETVSIRRSFPPGFRKTILMVHRNTNAYWTLEIERKLKDKSTDLGSQVLVEVCHHDGEELCRPLQRAVTHHNLDAIQTKRAVMGALVCLENRDFRTSYTVDECVCNTWGDPIQACD